MKTKRGGMDGWVKGVALAMLACVWQGVGYAQEGAEGGAENSRQEQEAKLQKIWEKIEKQKGPIDLPGGVARLNVPDGYVYLSPADTGTVLAMWGNPPGQETLGMLLPSRFSPFDEVSWAVTLGYVDDGHVSDEDADEIDYAELLDGMKEEAKERSEQRVKEGYPAIELVGWAEPPHYDASTKKLHWAKELAFNGDSDHVLNYNLRVLGREGVLVLNFIAGMNQLADINDNLERVAAIAEFKEGQRYADFNPDTDKLAAYGIGAVVAGGVMAKTGMLATIALLLKKLWFLVIAAVVAVYKFFTRSKPAK